MDESWRMSIGDGLARRRSIEKDRIRMSPVDVVAADEDDHDHDEDEDFLDVFGGPPRILRHHRRSAAGFYKEVFSPPLVAAAEAAGIGRRRNLPGFCIPPATNNNTSTSTRSLVRTEDGFYDDIFGSSHCIYTPAAAAAAAAATAVPARDRRSATKSGSGNNCKSRSNSSSDRDSSTSYLINSHPRANPRSSTIVHHHHRDHNDATLSSLASKLRPITIPTRQHDSSSQPSTLSGGGDEGSSSRTVPISNIHFSSLEDFAETMRRRSYYCPNCRRKPSDQTANNNMYHFSGGGRSPSSVASSAVLEPMTAPIELRELEKKVVVEVKRERERSSVGHRSVRETEGAAALDEAIAWAREKFWSHQASDITSEEILECSEEAKGISKEEPSLN